MKGSNKKGTEWQLRRIMMSKILKGDEKRRRWRWRESFCGADFWELVWKRETQGQR